jgi:hypothetical protein
MEAREVREDCGDYFHREWMKKVERCFIFFHCFLEEVVETSLSSLILH